MPEQNVATNIVRVSYDDRNLRPILDTIRRHCKYHRTHSPIITTAPPPRIHRERPTTTANYRTVFATFPPSRTTAASTVSPTNAPPLSKVDSKQPRQSNHEIRTKHVKNSKVGPARLPLTTKDILATPLRTLFASHRHTSKYPTGPHRSNHRPRDITLPSSVPSRFLAFRCPHQLMPKHQRLSTQFVDYNDQRANFVRTFETTQL